MRRLLDFIFGYIYVRVKDCRAAEFFEYLRSMGIETRISRHRGDEICTRTDYSVKKLLQPIRMKYPEEIFLLPRGLPAIIVRYKSRVGLFLGAVFCLFTVWQSGEVIWDFTVTGNERLTDEEIIEGLSELGCAVGERIDGINFDLLHNDFALKFDGVAWISVNMKGSLARVEVRETLLPETPDDAEYCNIVASEDAQIVLVEVFSGGRCVSPGDVVRAGELLISGVSEDKNGCVTYSRADGKVLARVRREIKAEISLFREEKVYTGEKTADYTVNILGKSINISNWGSIKSPLYDKIVTVEKLKIFSGYSLPVTVTKEVCLGYDTVKVKMSEKEAVDRAVAELKMRRDEILKTCEILSEETDAYFDGDVYVIKCSMICETDIAKVAAINIS